jgi:hypothetical protein
MQERNNKKDNKLDEENTIELKKTDGEGIN